MPILKVNMPQAPARSKTKSTRRPGLSQSSKPGLVVKGKLQAGLWLVATPIGNLSDFSKRAHETLEQADLILAEDTRVTRKLMDLHGIKGRVQRCDEAETASGLRAALDVLAQGGAVAFCSDAGTPGISDPGERLARGVIDAGFDVCPVPGPSAALAALTVSGLSSSRFFFAGFAPAQAGARARFFQDFAQIPATLIFYETGPRLGASLQAMLEVLGDRQACVARELTKMYEEVRRGPLASLVAHYQRAGAPKGEIVVVVEGSMAQDGAVDDGDLDNLLHQALATLRVKDAAQMVAGQTGLSRKEVYARALALTTRSPA